MPVLIRYVLARLGIGFALGSASAIGILFVNPTLLGGSAGLLEIWLVVYALGSAFALGYLATALGIDYDGR